MSNNLCAHYFGGKNQAAGYATSTSPPGQFTKASDNPVLQKNREKGGGVHLTSAHPGVYVIV